MKKSQNNVLDVMDVMVICSFFMRSTATELFQLAYERSRSQMIKKPLQRGLRNILQTSMNTEKSRQL